jgi:serine/threonine protein kinase
MSDCYSLSIFPYKTISKLGEGSYAKCYHIKSKTNGKEYCLKRFISDVSSICMFKEFIALSKCSHANVIKIISHGYGYQLLELYDCDMSLMLALEPNKSFREQIANQMLPQIVKALDYVHSIGIIHGDVKPSNILYKISGKLFVLADFGMAQFRCKKEVPYLKDDILSTPIYCCPEIHVDRTRFYGPEVDYWSLGATLMYTLESYTQSCKEHHFFHTMCRLGYSSPVQCNNCPNLDNGWGIKDIDSPYRDIITYLCAREPSRRHLGMAMVRELETSDLNSKKIYSIFPDESCLKVIDILPMQLVHYDLILVYVYLTVIKRFTQNPNVTSVVLSQIVALYCTADGTPTPENWYSEIYHSEPDSKILSQLNEATYTKLCQYYAEARSEINEFSNIWELYRKCLELLCGPLPAPTLYLEPVPALFTVLQNHIKLL